MACFTSTATLGPQHLQFAIDLTGAMNPFYDETNGGFWQSTNTPHLILQVKEDYDGAVPSANSVAALGLLRLGKITDQQEYIDMAEKTLLFLATISPTRPAPCRICFRRSTSSSTSRAAR